MDIITNCVNSGKGMYKVSFFIERTMGWAWIPPLNAFAEELVGADIKIAL